MPASVPDLLLDPQIKAWVLLPISIVMVLVGVLRTYISMLLEASPKLESRKLVREQQHIKRLQNYSANFSTMTYKEEYDNKVSFLIQEYSGPKYLKQQPSVDPNDAPNPLTDPGSTDFLMQSMKSSMANYVPQTIIMWWVNYFFKGYVIMKVPFEVTANFKSMLQQSINTLDLDASYVSSVSWYFVNLLGLNAIYSLIFNDDKMVNKLMDQQSQMPIRPQLAGAGPSAQQLFKGSLESLQIAQFSSCAAGSPERILEKYK